MKILLVGSGGREHALAWKIAQSPDVTELIVAPGNAGTTTVALAAGGDAANADVAADDVEGLAGLAKEAGVDLVVIGPEAPLALGLSDRLRAEGIPAFGPSAAAAKLETSKAFAKEFMRENAIPTAEYGVFSDPHEAKVFLDRLDGPPYVIKADGLAAGKGVVIAETREAAEAEIDAMLSGRFGTASRTVVVEEFMSGVEASVFALTDGEAVRVMAAAQDHKRAFDHDAGPNTGGMGAYSPTPAIADADLAAVTDAVVAPTIAGMAKDGAPYRGVLYVGLMMTPAGPKVVEYNVRFGDPECQVLMARLQSDLVPYLLACAKGGLGDLPEMAFSPAPAVAVVLATRGYPEAYPKGSTIRGTDAAGAVDGVTVFHAGTARNAAGDLVAAGGRVLNVTAIGDTLEVAVARAYTAVDRIDWPEGFHRTDIAWRALKAPAD